MMSSSLMLANASNYCGPIGPFVSAVGFIVIWIYTANDRVFSRFQWIPFVLAIVSTIIMGVMVFRLPSADEWRNSDEYKKTHTAHITVYTYNKERRGEMSEQKRYTAAEMREAAKSPVYVGGDCEVHVKPEVYEMLEQAAEMLERAAEQKEFLAAALKNETHKALCGITLADVVRTELSIVDYVLCGKGGAE